MANGKILSIFVDESGKFQYPDQESRFYILGMVFHSQDVSIASQIDFLDHEFDNMGLDSSTFVFHVGPLIRQEKGYALMNRHFRGLIFNKMMNFARNVDFNYHCLDVDKKYITSSLQIAASTM